MKNQTSRGLKTPTRKPRRIFTGVNEELTFLAAGLGELGLSTEAIARECGLSEAQVLYRLHILGIKRTAYRAGKSKISKQLVKEYLHIAERSARDKANRI